MFENENERKILKLKEELNRADGVLIGAGAGLSASAGFVYDGEQFRPWRKPGPIGAGSFL